MSGIGFTSVAVQRVLTTDCRHATGGHCVCGVYDRYAYYREKKEAFAAIREIERIIPADVVVRFPYLLWPKSCG
jgi:hypothetical protein